MLCDEICAKSALAWTLLLKSVKTEEATVCTRATFPIPVICTNQTAHDKSVKNSTPAIYRLHNIVTMETFDLDVPYAHVHVWTQTLP